MDSIDYWIAGDLITQANAVFAITIMTAIYIYEVMDFIKYLREQKQPWHKRFLGEIK